MIEIGLSFNKMSLILNLPTYPNSCNNTHFTDLGIKINGGSQVLTIGRGQHCKQFAIKTISPFGFSHTLFKHAAPSPTQPTEQPPQLYFNGRSIGEGDVYRNTGNSMTSQGTTRTPP